MYVVLYIIVTYFDDFSLDVHALPAFCLDLFSQEHLCQTGQIDLLSNLHTMETEVDRQTDKEVLCTYIHRKTQRL